MAFMKKKTKQNIEAIIKVFINLALGGLFIAGGFTGVILLSALPLVLHQIVGWAIIGLQALALLDKLM